MKLVSPLGYLLIHHPQKRVVDFVLPLTFAVLLTALIVYFTNTVTILGKDGLIDSLVSFVQFLTGFYIAALAAVATFPNKNIDEVADGSPLKLKGKELTRRQFLSYMFGFLAFTGFAFVSLSELLMAMQSEIYLLEVRWGEYVYLHFKAVTFCLYLFVFFVIVFTSLYGLYYLTEKIHESKSYFSKPMSSRDEVDEES